MNDIILKKKKKKQKEINYIKNENNLIKYNLSNSPKNKNNKKPEKKQLSLDVNADMSNSTLRLNSFSINQDETLGKLNIDNNNIKIFDISQ